MKFKSVIIIGTGMLPYQCAKQVLSYGIQPFVLEFQADSFSTLSKRCVCDGISYSNVTHDFLHNFLSKIEEETLIVSANNTYLFPQDIVKKANLFIINFHPALLPFHPGRNAEAWAIYDDDFESGITWHVITDRIDNGSILKQDRILLDDKMTSLKLMQKQFQIAAFSFKEVFSNIVESDDAYKLKNNYPFQHLSEKIHLSTDKPNDGFLDPTWPVHKMSSFLRSMDYGALNTLGSPMCILDNRTYCWDRYKILLNNQLDSIRNENYYSFSDGVTTICLFHFREKV